MKIKEYPLRDELLKKDFGESIIGNLVFTDLDQKDIEKLSFDQFKEIKKKNYVSNFEIIRTGNPDDDDPNYISELCTKIELNDIKLDQIPLVDTEIYENTHHSSEKMNQVEEEFLTKLEKMDYTKTIELDRESNSESFLESFNSGTLKITPSKGIGKKNTHFNIEINGCYWMEHGQQNQNINESKNLFLYTSNAELDMYGRTKKMTKELYQLQNQVRKSVYTKGKIPIKLFNKFPYNDFSRLGDIKNKDEIFIASLRNNKIYKIEDD